MKKKLLCFVMIASAFVGINSYAQWTTIVTDAVGDGQNTSLMDGTELAYQYDEAEDMLSFRVSTSGISASQSMAVGVNIMVNYPSGGSTFNFWGNNNANAYHRLLTAWVTGTPSTGYSGTIGIADATGLGGGNYTNLSSNNLDISVDTNTNEIIITLDRADLIPNSALGEEILVAAAVGSNTAWNDDIYSPSATISLSDGGSDVLIESIAIQGASGVTTVTSGDGSLQMNATILPSTASSTAIEWSVVNGTGAALIDTNGLLSGTLNGSVTVTATATDGSGISGSTEINFAIPGLAYDELILTELSVYPNPASDYLILSNENKASISIYAQNGKMLMGDYNIEGEQKIDISFLAPGIYYLIVSINNESVQKAKFIKQ